MLVQLSSLALPDQTADDAAYVEFFSDIVD